MYKIAAIIVTFNPIEAIFSRLLKAIDQQVEEVIIVDNGSSDLISSIIKNGSCENVVYIDQGGNHGLANAFNVGIDEAIKLGASHVVLFDQDSIPEADMVKTLSDAMSEKVTAGFKVAAVGPRYTDIKGINVSPVSLVGITLCQISCKEEEVKEVDHLISSGCMISIDAFNAVGGMEEELFIDNVDVEWSLRAKHKGFVLYGVCAACMQHDMGDQLLNVLGHKVNVHSPLRNYYMIRNGVWLIKQPWVPFRRRLAEFFKLMKKYIVYSLFIGSSFENWKMMSRGVYHGLGNRMGKYEC